MPVLLIVAAGLVALLGFGGVFKDLASILKWLTIIGLIALAALFATGKIKVGGLNA